MIWTPKPGQRIQIRYAKAARAAVGHHGATGTVITAARGPGPRNAAIQIDGAAAPIIVPRGNLFPAPPSVPKL